MDRIEAWFVVGSHSSSQSSFVFSLINFSSHREEDDINYSET